MGRVMRFALVLCSLAMPLSATAQQQARGRILGVFDDVIGQPLPGADVIDLATGTKATTSETGTVSLRWLGPGSTILQIRKLGYESKMQAVTVSPTDTVSVTVVLRPLTPTLPTVTTSAKEVKHRSPNMTGFEERRTLGQGKFLSSEDLRREAPGRPMNLVLQSHGFTGNRGCRRPQLFINGQRQSTFALPDVENTEAVEFYSGESTVPSQFGGLKSLCGTLVFWLRESPH